MPAGKSRGAAARPAHPPVRRGGRPPRDASLQLRDRILDVASAMFLNQGYGATSIEAVASGAGVSKRTFYHRFEDKPALMSAVVARIIDTLRPPVDTPIVVGSTVEEMLLHLAGLILHSALTPQALALHRLIVAESQRFPDLAAVVARAGGRGEAVALISQLLVRHSPGKALKKDAAEFAAEQFLQLVVSLPQMRAMGLGAPMSRRELDAWIQRSVAIFLGGFASVK